ncbi:MAG: hypothetical protein K2W95_02075 [Candidatus Obscuribacterales bacterium]|nr:hypothetical protein [Candidatus Obscuribacterales bacterium]
MKVTFRQSGGFAPIFVGFQVDTDAAPGPESTELEKLVIDSGIMKLSDAKVKGARDVYFYTFDIQMAELKHSVTLDQLSVPPAVQPLVEFLKARSRNMLPD